MESSPGWIFGLPTETWPSGPGSYGTDAPLFMGHDEPMSTVAEFTIEPFVEGDPGPHVKAAIAVAEAAGLDVEVGPFGTAVEGETITVLDAVDAVVRAAVANGATRVSLQLTVAG